MAHTNQEIARGSAVFKYGFSSPAQLHDWMQERADIPGVGLVGRSNVGKSSLINALFGKNTARVSKTPGRTRQINTFEFKFSDDTGPFYLFDLPGYGHAEVSKQMTKNWEMLMSVFFDLAGEKTLMLNVQDARHPNQKADIQFHDFLSPFDFTTTLVFNKLDKLKKQKDRNQLKKQVPGLLEEYHWVKDIHYISAESGQGIDALESSLISFLLEHRA